MYNMRGTYIKIIDDTSNFIFLEDEPQKADIIFIPGGSYAARHFMLDDA